jgi:putative ABC transport system permease protein
MRGQGLAIAVVIAGGVATLLMSLSSLESLRITRDNFYRDYRFADVFTSLKRAPEELLASVEAIPGVQMAETRVVVAASLEVPDFPDPATGLVISIPDGRNPELNRLFLRLGRLPEAGRADEVVISEPFSEAHGLLPGDSFSAVIQGRRQTLTVSGIGLTPEHIYQIKPGDLFPDPQRYGILWMNRSQLAAANDMEGAFNDLVLTLARGASEGEVIDALNRLLEPYGGIGAVGRDDQLSHSYLEAELEQLATMARVFPTIFLGVAAFLLNVVLARLIATEREQIAVLKAFGYRDWEVGLHYGQLVLLMTVFGLILGTAGGYWLGELLGSLYADFFRFPYLTYRLSIHVIAIGALVTGAAAMLGALSAVRRAARLPPAEAMRPEPPATYRPTVIERLGLQRWFTQPTRMILRHLERRPLKALLSITGIAFACGILIVGNFQQDAVNHMIEVQFGLANRYDVAVTFVEPTSRRVIHDIEAMDGVLKVEPQRSVPVTLRHGHRTFRTSVQGVMAEGDLRRVLDADLQIMEPSPDGVMLTDFLAELLAAQPGDTITVDVLEGRRQTLQLVVAGLVNEYVGVSAYMEIDALNRWLGEGSAVSGAVLTIDSPARDAVTSQLMNSPRVAGVTHRLAAIESFRNTMAETVLVFSFISTLLAGSIAFGVVYNSARIALSERGRELASLRVLGLTRDEIGYILLGELAVLTAAAIPLGFLIGRGLCWYLTVGLRSDLYRVPLIVEPSTYAVAAAVVTISAILSGLIVRRRLHRLDLVAVLKTRE